MDASPFLLALLIALVIGLAAYFATLAVVA
jgi:hypothetical protein